MDPEKLQSLPPLKRLRLLHQDNNHPSSPLLPAKKRKESREPSPDSSDSSPPISTAVTTTYWLPAKKRVWAPPPDFTQETTIDLNVEYKPDLGEEEEEEGRGVVAVVDDGLIGQNSEEIGRNDDGIEVNEEEVVSGVVPIVDDGLFGQDSEENEKQDDGTEVNDGSHDPDSEEIERQDDEVEVNGEEGEEEEEDGIVCTICESTDGNPQDPIVFCDGCDLTVHSKCYGNPLVEAIPEGDWFCARCLVSRSSPNKEIDDFSCCLCPVIGGAVKPTNDGKWAHIVCALFVPEVFFQDGEGRVGINCSEVPKRRWKEVCYVCGGRNGCAIECSELNCGLWFHVSCGLKEGLCIEYREGRRKGGIVAGFCKEHTALWEQQQRTGKFKIVAREK